MKKFTSLVLAIAMILGLNASSIYASSEADIENLQRYIKEFDKEEKRRLIESSKPNSGLMGVFKENVPIDNMTTLYPHCLDCGEFTVSVCAKEAVLYDEGYHRGLLGLVETDCYAYYYRSRGAAMCPSCARVIQQYGYHDCWELHKKCSKGNYDVCPMQVS